MKTIRFAAVVTCVLIALAGCNRKKTQQASPPGVTVAPATKGYVTDSTEIIGQAKAYEDVDLVARVKGFLVKRNFKEGHLVKKGQLLFEIEKAEYLAQVKIAEANLEKGQAKLINAKTDYERQAKLLKENATAKRTYDDALANKMEAEAEVMEAQAELDKAKLNLSYTDIKAPFEGRVGIATYSVGNVVGPESDKLGNIVDLDPVRIKFNVSEVILLKMKLQRIKEGNDQKAPRSDIVVRLAFQNGKIYSHTGEIKFASNKINTSTGTLLVEAVFPNKEQIIVPGMYVKVIIEDKAKIPALLVPQPAVQEDQAGKYVLVVDSANKVVVKRVKTGLKSGPCIQVKEGLKEGDKVIIEGIQKVRPNIVVKPVVDMNYMLSTPGIKPDDAAAKKTSTGSKKAAPAKK